MRDLLRKRFRLEIGLATITGLVFVLTLTQRQWIEVLFGVDPDHGSGLLEWAMVITSFLATVTFCALAGNEWRKSRAALS